jgi:hypothetical protein
MYGDAGHTACGKIPLMLAVNGIDGKLFVEDFIVDLWIEHLFLA